MSEKSQPRRRGMRVAGAAMAGLSAAPGTAGQVTRSVEEKVIETGVAGISAGASLAEELNLIHKQHNPDSNLKLVPTAPARERLALDSPWLEHLSPEQDQLIESFDSLTPEKRQFLRDLVLGARWLQAHGAPINGAVMVAQGAIEGGWKHGPGFNDWGIKQGDWRGGKPKLYPDAAEWNPQTKAYETDPDYFRQYPEFKAALENYGIFTGEHFPLAAQHSQDRYQYLYYLLHQPVTEDDGSPGERAWATDPEYGPKVNSIIDEYQLEKLIAIPDQEFTP